MGWQGNSDWQDDPAGPGAAAGFAHGGPWDAAPPSAALAAALQAAAGPGSRYQGADLDALVGMARQWAAIESWAAAEQLATLRAMTRASAGAHPRPRHPADLPDGWDDSLNYEIAAALAMGPVSAGNLAALARALGTRLQGTGRLLAAGLLTRAKAKLIAAILEPLTDSEAARAESLLLGDLPGKTYYQVERLTWRAALAIAPDTAERRRKAAERDHARVTLFREESGTAGLSGRDLPAAQALSGHANILERAAQYAASGAFPGHTQRTLEALAYLHLLNGVSADDAIAYARTPEQPPPDEPPADNRLPADATGDDGPGKNGLADERPSDDGPGISESDGDGPDGDPPGSSGEGGNAGPDDGEPVDSGTGDNEPEHGALGSPSRHALPEVTVPLRTLLGLTPRPGENRLLGSLDPALARDLAAAAARSPTTRWEITIVDACGYAVGHGVARPVGRHGSPAPPTSQATTAQGPGPERSALQGPAQPGPAPEPPAPWPSATQPSEPKRPGPPSSGLACAFSARMNVTVPESLLRDLATARNVTPRSGPPPGGWQLKPRKPRAEQPTGWNPSAADDSWLLTLPGGRELAVRFDFVPTHDCDHRYQVASYLRDRGCVG